MLKINDIMRASGVTRWHIVRTIRPQSLAEHTFDVTMIARAIAKIAGYDDAEIIKGALLHDLDEIVTGDFPTQTKVKAREYGWELNNLGERYQEVTGRKLSGDEQVVIKVADKLADLYWLWLHAVGPHANGVYETIAGNYDVFIRGDSIPDNIREAAFQVQAQMLSEEFTV